MPPFLWIGSSWGLIQHTDIFQSWLQLHEIFAILRQDKIVVLDTQAGKMLEQAALICRDMDRYVYV